MLISWTFEVFVSIIIVLNPFSLMSHFMRLTEHKHLYSIEEKRRIVQKGCLTGGIVIFMCAIFGGKFFRLINVPPCSLRIFGGLLLLLNSIDMIIIKQSRFSNTTQSEEKEANMKIDISVFPLGIPLIAGPSTCASVLVLTEVATANQMIAILVILLFALTIVYYTLCFSDEIRKVIGITFTNAFVRVSGIILGGIATNSILQGIGDFISEKL